MPTYLTKTKTSDRTEIIKMKKDKKLFITLVFLIVVQAAVAGNGIEATLEQKIMDGEFWRNQVLIDLMPYWYKHVIDEEHGAFYLNLSRDWKPMPPWDKMPSMISRQIFSFSTAYLLSGEEKYLEVARKSKDYLLKYGWDKKYGGWFSSISQTGEPKETCKGASAQLYSNVGLTQYYFVTGDKRALSHVLKSVEIHRTHAHDKKFDGYYMKLNRNLSVIDSSKAKHSHYGQGSLMPNLILATHDSRIISFSKHLADLSIKRMIDPVEGWILGYPKGFDREWNYVPYLVNGKESVYLGASLTAAIFFLRLYYLTGKDSYLKHGKALGDKLCSYGWDRERGAWHTSYHEIEHGFLNYLFLNLYVNKKPVKLHFKLDGPNKHFVSPVDEQKVQITEVLINGKPWTNFDARERSITLPAVKKMNVQVTLNLKKK